MADMRLAQNANIDFIPIGYGYTDPSRLLDGCGIQPVSDVVSLRRELQKL
jgi:hypothetical protein